MAGLKFRVLLDSSDNNEIFRDVLIADHENFDTFYKAILDAFHFGGDQMASFYMSNDNWDKGYEISLFDMAFGEDPEQILPGVMSECRIADFIQEEDQKIILVHDFMRMWIFLIELIDFSQDTPEYPRVVLSVGNAPAEDSKSPEANINFETEFDGDGDDDEDDYGFGDFEEGFESYDDFDDY